MYEATVGGDSRLWSPSSSDWTVQGDVIVSSLEVEVLAIVNGPVTGLCHCTPIKHCTATIEWKKRIAGGTGQ